MTHTQNQTGALCILGHVLGENNFWSKLCLKTSNCNFSFENFYLAKKESQKVIRNFASGCGTEMFMDMFKKQRQDCEHPKNSQFDIYAIILNFFNKFQWNFAKKMIIVTTPTTQKIFMKIKSIHTNW